jgi:hypothetical protein
MNLIATIIAVIVLILGYGVLKSYLIVSIITFILLGGLLFLTNALPISSALISNDGCNAIALSKNKEAMFSFWVQLMVMDMQSKGIRLKDMPDEWFFVPGDVPTKNLFYSTLKVFACNRTLDTLDTVKCEAEIEALLNSNWLIIGLHRALLTIDLIYCRLVNHGRGNDYRALVTQDVKNVMKSMKNNPAILRTEYAAELLYDGNKAAADKKLCEFDAALKTHPYPGDSELERQLVNLALERYNSNLER